MRKIATVSLLVVLLSGSLVAEHVYGLTDAITLGSGSDMAFWLILALSAALWRTLPGSIRSSASTAKGPPTERT